MSPMLIKCPTCKREIEWAQSQFRPFCSERCKLIDLGAWLTEKHTIPGENTPEEPAQDDEAGTR